MAAGSWMATSVRRVVSALLGRADPDRVNPIDRVSPIDRLARASVVTAARRWPPELSEALQREWCAELDALRADPTGGPLVRAWLAIRFAGSLLICPAVEATGAAHRTWGDRARALGSASLAVAALPAVALLAAGAFNVVHDANHALRRGLSGVSMSVVSVVLLVLAMLLMAFVAAAAARTWPTGRPRAVALTGTAVLGLALFAFLLTGNQVAVMPFMGWIDLAPAIGGWTVLIAVTMWAAVRVTRSGRRVWAAATGAIGVLVAVDGAAVLGSLHAATVLGIGAGSAPAWFPLALLPGGTVRFGPVFGAGTPPFGPVRTTVPMFHGSDILLGNVSAIVGPLLLCSVFLMAYVLRATRAAMDATSVAAPAVTPAVTPAAGPGSRPSLAGAAARGAYWSVRTATASVAIMAGVVVGARLSAVTPDPGVAFARIADNSVVFGFGFATGAAGRAVIILAVGLCLLGPASRGARRGVTGQRA